MRWLRWTLWPLLIFHEALAAAPSSTALAEARDCMLRGGKLDLFRDGVGTTHAARCRYSACPALSTEVYYSCVAPELAGEAREIALTLHVPCSNCAADNGVEVAGQAWMALAAALQIPLQEMQVSVLLMREQLWRHHPLQHFTLTRSTEDPMVTPSGGLLYETATSLGERWDFFMAVRIHSARINPGDKNFQEIMAFQPRSIQEAFAVSAPISVFEAVQRKTDKVAQIGRLSAVFKIRGLAWGEEPPPDAGVPNEVDNAGSGDPRRPSDGGSLPTEPPISFTTTGVTAPLLPITPAPTPQGCRCRSTWLGDGFCDDYCNIEACEWDRGDCGNNHAGQNPGAEQEVAWPNGYYSPSTSEWEAWPIGSGTGGDAPGQRSPIVDLTASDRESILHIDALGEGGGDPWRADEPVKEYGESPGISPVLIAGLSVLGCIVPIACCFARRPMRQMSPASKTSWGFGGLEKVEDEERGLPGNRNNLSKFSGRTFSSQCSDETTDTGGSSSPHSGSWGLGGLGARKEPKVHPAPEEEHDIRNSRGDWRLPRSQSHPPSQGPRPEAASGSWQTPQQPAPTLPGSWHQRQEQERQRRQREKEEQQKSQRQQTRADQEAWQQEWIKNKREQDRLEKELKHQEEEQQKRLRKEAAQKRQQEEEERQRKWREQEEHWKKQAEDLKREKEKQEEEAARRRRQQQQEEQFRKEQEQQQRQKAEKQRQKEQQQQPQRGREPQRKDQKAEKDKADARGGFFGRWRAKSEPPKDQSSAKDRQQASQPKGSQWTKWPGSDMPRATSTDDKARTAKENQERAAREQMQKAAEHKASSLLDTVMKQIDRTRNSSLEERKKVFRDLQRQLHPDKNLHDQEAAKLAFQKLMESRDSYLS